MKTALNRITFPALPLEQFLAFSRGNGFDAVELRNDLPGLKILDDLQPGDVRELCRIYDIRIITINALQRFNDAEGCLDTRVKQLHSLVEIASLAGIDAVVLCPVNDAGDIRTYGQRMDDTIAALAAFGPVLQEAGILGFVEPLGFSQCSLRFKRDAVQAIEQSGYQECFKLVHDTFHHYLSGEAELFPSMTGLIHVSGVLSGTPAADISDDDRVLVTEDDILGNREQVRGLLSGGFSGYCSFECFSQDVQTLEPSMLSGQLSRSISVLFD